MFLLLLDPLAFPRDLPKSLSDRPTDGGDSSNLIIDVDLVDNLR